MSHEELRVAQKVLEKRVGSLVRERPVHWARDYVSTPFLPCSKIDWETYVESQVRHEVEKINEYMTECDVSYETAVTRLQLLGDIFGQKRVKKDLTPFEGDLNKDLARYVATEIAKQFEEPFKKPERVWLNLTTNDANNVLVLTQSRDKGILAVNNHLNEIFSDSRYKVVLVEPVVDHTSSRGLLKKGIAAIVRYNICS